MADSRSGQTPAGEEQQESPPAGSHAAGSHAAGSHAAESHAAAEALADLKRLIDEVRALGSQMMTNLAALAHAQWRLMAYVLTGSAMIWSIRLGSFLVIAGLALASWVFLNVAVWRLVGDLSDYPAAPPLVLFLLNSASAAVLFLWQKGLRLP